MATDTSMKAREGNGPHRADTGYADRSQFGGGSRSMDTTNRDFETTPERMSVPTYLRELAAWARSPQRKEADRMRDMNAQMKAWAKSPRFKKARFR